MQGGDKDIEHIYKLKYLLFLISTSDKNVQWHLDEPTLGKNARHARCIHLCLHFYRSLSSRLIRRTNWHYRYSFCMDGCEVAVIKQFCQVDLSRCLQCHDSLSLESEVCLEFLCNLTNQSAFVKKKKKRKKKQPYNSHWQTDSQISWKLNLCMLIVYFVKSDVLKHWRKDVYCEVHLQIFSTHLWNGSFLMSNSVDFWYRRISRSATVPGLYLQRCELIIRIAMKNDQKECKNYTCILI